MSLVLNRSKYEDLTNINTKAQKYLRLAATESGFSDLEIALKSNIPQSTVYRVLNAKTQNPSYAAVFKLCKVLGIDLPNEDQLKKTSSDVLYLQHQGNQNIKRNQSSIESCEANNQQDSNYRVGVIIDDCGDSCFAIDSKIHFTEMNEQIVIKENDKLVVEVLSSLEKIVIPMSVVPSPRSNEWILFQLSNNKAKHQIFSIPKEIKPITVDNKIITIVGKIL